MASDKVELANRMEITRPEDTVRGLIFNAVIELVRNQVGAAAAEELQRRLFKRAPVDFFAYPARDFLQLLYAAADLLEPRLGSAEEALRACGGAAVSGFFESAIGQTLITIVGRGDPKRLFNSAPTAYSTTVSYGSRESIALGDKKLRLVFKGDMQPVQFHEGLLAEALRSIGARGTVKGRASGYCDSEYLIEWE